MRPFKKFLHIALNVSDVERSVEFYKKLGMEQATDIKRGNGKTLLTHMRVAEGQHIELWQACPENSSTPESIVVREEGDTFAHLSLMVDDLLYTAVKWAEQGIEMVYTPFRAEPIPLEPDKFDPLIGADCNKIGWIADPDGNWIEVMEELEDSWQRRFELSHPFD